MVDITTTAVYNHLSRYERDYLKQLVLECDIQRFSRQESKAYIEDKLERNFSESYLDKTRALVKKSAKSKLEMFREHKTAYIEQFFKRIVEIENLQKEAWTIYHTAQNDNKPSIQIDCIQELHQLTITLANLYEILPAFTGQSLVTIDKLGQQEH